MIKEIDIQKWVIKEKKSCFRQHHQKINSQNNNGFRINTEKNLSQK